jgi:NAD(P)-dependent dehydrogenase (short-subunit alcohol dehydrogenase family)
MNTGREAARAQARNRFAQRTAVVVGGGQREGATVGNGRATALALAREGAHVLVADRDLDAAAETVAIIHEEGGQGEPHQMDVTSESDCQRLAEVALASLGSVDVLVNNVGIVLDDVTLEEWNRTLAVNLTGAWLTCKSVVPAMVARQRGAIVNISSIASLMPAAPGPLGYAVSKVGIDMLTRTLAFTQARHGIRVNAVAPGMIDTPLGVDRVVELRGVERERVARERAQPVPMGRQGSAWEIADAVAFLASDEASYITGVILPVDGGVTLGHDNWDMQIPDFAAEQ